jgi:hypothetical protein
VGKNNLDAALAKSCGEPAPGPYYETPQSSVALEIGLSRLRMALCRVLDRKVLFQTTEGRLGIASRYIRQDDHILLL